MLFVVRWRYVKGKKHERDWILLLETDGEEVFTVEDVLRLLQFMFENEDRIYPKSEGFRGREMLLEAINRVAKGEPIPKVLADYKLQAKTAYLHEFM